MNHHGHGKACSQTGDQGLTALLALEEEGPGRHYAGGCHPPMEPQGGGAVEVGHCHLVLPLEKVGEVHGEGEEGQKSPLLGEHPHKAQQGQQPQ